MKKLFVLISLISFSNIVHASKARLVSLGESENGSFYISDNRNIFLTPTSVLWHKNFLTYELEGERSGEAGFVSDLGDYIIGAQFGRDLPFNAIIDLSAYIMGRQGADPSYATNTLDFFFAGKGRVKWTLTGAYSNQFNDNVQQGNGDYDGKVATEVFDLGIGLAAKSWVFFIKSGMRAEAKHTDVDVDIKQKSAYDAGVSYSIKELTFFARYSDVKWKFNKQGEDTDANIASLVSGVGRRSKLNGKSNLYSKLEYKEIYNYAVSDVPQNIKLIDKDLAATLALEVDVHSWLQLRASISQSVLINKASLTLNGDHQNETTENTTLLAAGASIKVGELTIDGVVGESSADVMGVIDSTNLMSQVSLTYKF